MVYALFKFSGAIVERIRALLRRDTHTIILRHWRVERSIVYGAVCCVTTYAVR